MEIRFSARELDWLNDYAGNQGMSIEAAVRQALRFYSLVIATPGAAQAVSALASARLGPMREPMPPLPQEPERPASRERASRDG